MPPTRVVDDHCRSERRPEGPSRYCNKFATWQTENVTFTLVAVPMTVPSASKLPSYTLPTPTSDPSVTASQSSTGIFVSVRLVIGIDDQTRSAAYLSVALSRPGEPASGRLKPYE